MPKDFYFGSFDPFMMDLLSWLTMTKGKLTFCDIILIITVNKNRENPSLSPYTHQTQMIHNHLLSLRIYKFQLE